MLGGGSERVAEFHQAVPPRKGTHRQRQGSIRFWRLKIQIAKRINKEGCASPHFIPQHGNSSARVIKRFNHHIFELFSKELLDGAFVLFLDFSIVRQQTNRVETAGLAFAIGVKKPLDSVSGVGPFSENLSDGCMPRALR